MWSKQGLEPIAFLPQAVPDGKQEFLPYGREPVGGLEKSNFYKAFPGAAAPIAHVEWFSNYQPLPRYSRGPVATQRTVYATEDGIPTNAPPLNYGVDRAAISEYQKKSILNQNAAIGTQ